MQPSHSRACLALTCVLHELVLSSGSIQKSFEGASRQIADRHYAEDSAIQPCRRISVFGVCFSLSQRTELSGLLLAEASDVSEFE